jgi:hypothetical protein
VLPSSSDEVLVMIAAMRASNLAPDPVNFENVVAEAIVVE